MNQDVITKHCAWCNTEYQTTFLYSVYCDACAERIHAEEIDREYALRVPRQRQKGRKQQLNSTSSQRRNHG